MKTRSEWFVDNNSVDSMFYSKEETIQSVKSNFDIRRYKSAEGCSVTIDSIAEQVIIQDHHNPINESDVDKKMLLPMSSTAKTGSYVFYRGSTWMIISNINVVDDAYKTCQIQYCNYTLKWQSPTGTILSYPCIDETTSSVGLDEGNVITTGNSIHKIKLPFDENTVLLDTDDRFFIDDLSVKIPKVFAISNPNRTEFKFGSKGLIQLTIKQNAYNAATDRIDLGVCDYVEPTTEPEPSGDIIVGISCTSSTSFANKIKLGVTYAFASTVKYADGTTVTNAIPRYSLDTTYGGLVVLDDKLDGTCTVKVNSSATSFVTKHIILTCQDTRSGYSSSITMIVAPLY